MGLLFKVWATTENFIITTRECKYLIHRPPIKILASKMSLESSPFDFGNHGNVVNVRKSKPVGEPPLVLGLSVWTAAKNALQAAGVDTSIGAAASNEENLKTLSPIRGRIRNLRTSTALHRVQNPHVLVTLIRSWEYAPRCRCQDGGYHKWIAMWNCWQWKD